ncbi:MAG: carbohydrate binding domain-containing protein [Bacteroidaceae bacterium]|nr:carbohydrate binding domain-containing protein [Bacteroidaceae bacterium]
MKKHFRFSVMAALAAFAFAACEEVPELPYNPEGGEEDDTTSVVVGDNLLENGDFELWDGNTPTHWKSSTTASSATLAQSTDAHGGSYAVIVQGNSEFNKRIAYKEITLKPGTYYITFYAKATAGDASVRPGYVGVLADGKADSQNYMYGSYVNNITSSEWTEVKHEFTLDAQKTINLIIMNPKSTASDVLIDDYSLTTADGGLAEEGGSNDDNTGDEEDDPIVPTGDNLVANGDFEAWSNNVPTNWKSTTSASKGNVEQSTDAHSGSYAVKVIGKSGVNNRLAYQELTLKAGTYYIQFYTKAATEDGSSARPGYAPIKEDGSMGSYAYGDYVNDLTTTEWTEVNHQFTLSEQTKLNLVIMCAGKPGTDILVDDYSLTTADGGILEGEGDNKEEEEEPGDVTYTGKYVKVTEFTEAGTYLLVAGDQAFTQLDANKTYGYMPAATVSISNGEIAASATTEAAKLTITSTDGGYTLQDASTRYIYMKGTYNSFNIGTTAEESYIWTITANGDETFSVTNIDMDKTIMYDRQYSSYGSYPEKTDTRLYVNIYKYIAE